MIFYLVVCTCFNVTIHWESGQNGDLNIKQEQQHNPEGLNQ